MSAERLPALDLLRGGAALAVAIPHLLLVGFPGDAMLEAAAVLGVEIFFVLSGFVLAPQLLMCFEQPRQVPTFLQRRWMRTIPPYLLALVAMSLIAGQLGSDNFLRYAFYVQNFLRQANEVDYFTIAWSLSVEEWFYIAFPAVLLMARALVTPSRRRAVDVAVAFAVAISVARLLFGDYQNWGEQVRRVTVFRLDSIAYGVLLNLLGIRFGRTLASMAVLCTGAVAALCLVQIVTGDGFIGKALFPFAGAAFGAATILMALSFNQAIALRPGLSLLSTWAGRASFSTYLFHPIISILLIQHLPSSFGLGVKILITLGALPCFSVLFYWLFERPILSARPQYRSTGTRQSSEASAMTPPPHSLAATKEA